MRHLAAIQSEFLKRAISWDQRSYNYQKKYLELHPDSPLRITAKPRIKSPFMSRRLVERMFEVYTPGELKLKNKYESQGRLYKKFTGSIDDGHYITVTLAEPTAGKIYFRETVNDESMSSRLTTLTNRDEATRLLTKRYPNAVIVDENIESYEKQFVQRRRELQKLESKIRRLQNTPDKVKADKLFKSLIAQFDNVESKISETVAKRKLGIIDEHTKLLDEIEDITT